MNVGTDPEVRLFTHGLASFTGTRYMVSDQASLTPTSDTAEQVEVVEINGVLSSIITTERRIDVLKMDCEGCEWELIRTISPSIYGAIDTICIEIHGDDHDRLLCHLLRNGFRVALGKRLPWKPTVASYLLAREHSCNADEGGRLAVGLTP